MIERQELILQMFAEDKSLSIRKLCEKAGLSMVRLDSLPGGRVSLALPRTILRMTAEKAGAGMCRLGLGQGGTLCMSTLSLPLPQRFFNASRY